MPDYTGSQGNGQSTGHPFGEWPHWPAGNATPFLRELGGMSDLTHSAGSVLVIVDPAFSGKLRTVPAGQPVWIAMSTSNESVVRSLWASQVSTDHLTGITGFRFDEGVSAEDLFLAELDTIDLHHGPHSSASSYVEIAVRGARPTAEVRAGLSEFGFTDFTETEDGFTARRTQEEAMRLQE